MPTDSTNQPHGQGGHDHGRLSASISSAIVHLFAEHTGRGPTKARTTINADLVVVILRDSMTTGERTLVQAGKEDEVLGVRRAFQETMRSDLVGTVERLTDRNVVTFMSANNADPDAAAEIFLMDRPVFAS